MIGVSRKSTLGALTGRAVDDRLAAGLAAAALAVDRGADVVRTHDVAATVDALKTAVAIGEMQIVRIARKYLSRPGHHGSRTRPLADVSAVRSGIPMQCATNRARYSGQLFEPRESFASRRGDQMSEFCPAAGGQPMTFNFDFTEGRRRQMEH